MDSLKRAFVNLDWYERFCEDTLVKGIMVFCPEGYNKEQQISTRVFVHYLGIPEDPATGSATGCLAGYLVKHNYFGTTDIDFIAGQGYEIARPSQLHLKAKDVNGKIDIQVGGRVFYVAEGLW